MRYFILIAGTLLLATGTATAAASSTQERVGVGIGTTVGALIGGPPGAIIGAAVGAKFGDNYHRKDERIDSLSTALDASNQQVDALQQTVAGLNRDLSILDSDLRRLQAQSRPELVALLAAGIEMDLLFRTAEHVLVPDTESRLQQLASTVAAMPDVRVRLDGFADARGNADYNRELSAKRAAHIRDLLIAAGVAPERITSRAHGETAVTGTDADNFALQRKVSLTLFIDDTQAVAATPR